jgi:hypothetical protein
LHVQLAAASFKLFNAWTVSDVTYPWTKHAGAVLEQAAAGQCDLLMLPDTPDLHTPFSTDTNFTPDSDYSRLFALGY